MHREIGVRAARFQVRALFVILAGLMPAALAAQSQQPASTALSPSANAGRRTFLQYCSYCHLPRGNSKDPAKKNSIGPLLNGMFQKEKPLTEKDVREFILRGIPTKMPGFQYGLNAGEIDDLIAFLKTI